MARRLRTATLIAATFLLVGARLAAGASVVSGKGILCGGSGPHAASITVSRTGDGLTLKFKAKNLTPGQGVRCGYECAFTGARVDVACGVVGASGRWSHVLERPAATCWGFLPFFNTGTTGSCLSGLVP